VTSLLFELVMHLYEVRSLLVTSHQPVSELENVFSTSTMTVAAVDRLLDHSTSIQINGASFCRKRARQLGCRSTGLFVALTRHQSHTTSYLIEAINARADDWHESAQRPRRRRTGSRWAPIHLASQLRNPPIFVETAGSFSKRLSHW
jgi:hypothetical protein